MNKITKLVVGAHIVATALIVGTFIALMASPRED